METQADNAVELTRKVKEMAKELGADMVGLPTSNDLRTLP